MPIRSLIIAGGVLVAATACSRQPNQAIPTRFAALAPATLSTTLLRLPAKSGQPVVYQPGALIPIPWRRAPDTLPALTRGIGADLDQRLVYALTTKAEIVGLDLETGRARSFVVKVSDAVLGPDGTLFALTRDSTITELRRRTPVGWNARLPQPPRTWFATLSREVMAIPSDDPPRLLTLRPDKDPDSVTLPPGPAAATAWGDLVAIAADTALVLYTLHDDQPFQAVDVPGAAKTVAFSPSGHRIYVGGNSTRLLVVDRYGHRVLRRIALPGAPAELRASLHGGWLLARPSTGADSVWVIDVTAGDTKGALPGGWQADLPLVIGDILVLRQGQDVVTIDLASADLAQVGRLADAAGDFYLPLGWSPADDGSGPLPSVAGTDSAIGSSDATIYLQVSSSQNPRWAEDFATRLRDAGLMASVLQPQPDEEAYRVVIGPYRTREEADSVGKGLGAPYFIYQPRAR